MMIIRYWQLRENKMLLKFIQYIQKNKLQTIIGFIIFTGAIMRLLFLNKEGLWYDEALTALSLKMPFIDMIKERLDAGHSPLYFIILYPFAKLFGISELVMRLPSVAASILSLYVFYLLAKKLFKDDKAVLISTLFFALSSLSIYFAQEARMYAMCTFIALLSFYYLIISIDEKKTKYWILYGVFTLLLFYLNASTVPLIFAQIFYIVYKREQILQFFVTVFIVGMLYLPMAFFYVKMKRLGFIEWLPPINIRTFAEFIYGFTFRPIPVTDAKGLYHIFLKISEIFSLIFSLGLFAFLVIRIFIKSINKVKGTKKEQDILILLFSWLIIPIIFMLIYSLLKQPMLGPKRYIITLSPAFYLLISYGISVIRWKKIRIIVFFIAFIFFYSALINFYFTPKREDWRGAVKHIDKNIKEGEVLYGDLSTQVMYKYYGKNEDILILDIKSMYSGLFVRGWILVRNREYQTIANVIEQLDKKIGIEYIDDFNSIKLYHF